MGLAAGDIYGSGGGGTISAKEFFNILNTQLYSDSPIKINFDGAVLRAEFSLETGDGLRSDDGVLAANLSEAGGLRFDGDGAMAVSLAQNGGLKIDDGNALAADVLSEETPSLIFASNYGSGEPKKGLQVNRAFVASLFLDSEFLEFQYNSNSGVISVSCNLPKIQGKAAGDSSYYDAGFDGSLNSLLDDSLASLKSGVSLVGDCLVSSDSVLYAVYSQAGGENNWVKIGGGGSAPDMQGNDSPDGSEIGTPGIVAGRENYDSPTDIPSLLAALESGNLQRLYATAEAKSGGLYRNLHIGGLSKILATLAGNLGGISSLTAHIDAGTWKGVHDQEAQLPQSNGQFASFRITESIRGALNAYASVYTRALGNGTGEGYATDNGLVFKLDTSQSAGSSVWLFLCFYEDGCLGIVLYSGVSHSFISKYRIIYNNNLQFDTYSDLVSNPSVLPKGNGSEIPVSVSESIRSAISQASAAKGFYVIDDEYLGSDGKDDGTIRRYESFDEDGNYYSCGYDIRLYYGDGSQAVIVLEESIEPGCGTLPPLPSGNISVLREAIHIPFNSADVKPTGNYEITESNPANLHTSPDFDLRNLGKFTVIFPGELYSANLNIISTEKEERVLVLDMIPAANKQIFLRGLKEDGELSNSVTIDQKNLVYLYASAAQPNDSTLLIDNSGSGSLNVYYRLWS